MTGQNLPTRGKNRANSAKQNYRSPEELSWQMLCFQHFYRFFFKLPILKIIKHVAIPKSAVGGENLLENQPKSNTPDGG
jgi:hypothetical protein